MGDKIEYIVFNCDYRARTEKAVFVAQNGMEQWIPIVALSDADGNAVLADEFSRGETIDIHVAKWFADKEGLV